MLATTKTGILLTTAATAVIAVGLIAGLNSSQGIARADNPRGEPGTTLETTIDVSTNPTLDGIELAQSQTSASDDAGHQTTDNLLRNIQALQDELKTLEEDLQDRTAQNQSDQATSAGAVNELKLRLEQKQAEILALRLELDNFRLAAAVREGTALAADHQSWDFQARDPQTTRIMAALDSEATIEFPGNPLRDVLGSISDSHNIPILFDENNLADAGISADEEVSFFISGGVTLRNALEIMFSNVAGVELDYIVENQVLKITTREQADSVMETRVYSLKQLPAEYSPEDIARVIIRSIAPETWRNSVVPSQGDGEYEEMMSGNDAYGHGSDYGMAMESLQPTGGRGAGSIEPLPGVLVVTQSQRVHRQIVDLLSQLKRQYEVAGGVGGMFDDYEGMDYEAMYDDYDSESEEFGSDAYGDFEDGAPEF